jgi:phosphoribosylglycinamide formyltransferase-1
MPRLAVFISGGGSNLQALLDSDVCSQIKIVLSDREAYGLERAQKKGIKTIQLSRKELGRTKLSLEIDKIMDEESIELIVLAGYLSIFTEEFSEKWRGKMINIHPSLLPKFGGIGMYGLNVHRAVIKSGEKESGCTVHFLGEGVDTGEIIMQARVPVLQDDTAETLQARILEEEHRILPLAVEKVLSK